MNITLFVGFKKDDNMYEKRSSVDYMRTNERIGNLNKLGKFLFKPSDRDVYCEVDFLTAKVDEGDFLSLQKRKEIIEIRCPACNNGDFDTLTINSSDWEDDVTEIEVWHCELCKADFSVKSVITEIGLIKEQKTKE
jgi:hypothetical protein